MALGSMVYFLLDVADPAAQASGDGSPRMRVLLSTYGGRGDVEPLVGLAVRLRELGAEVRICAPPDFSGLDRCAERLAEVGVPLVPAGPRCARSCTGRRRRRRPTCPGSRPS